jgi:hypothetical protein
MPASTFNEVTVSSPAGVAAPATQLVIAGGPDVLVFNTSTTVTVFLSQTNDALPSDAGTSRVSPLGPQQSIVFDGTLSVYAVVAAGLTAVVNLYPSATNYTPFNGVTSLFSAGTATGGGFTTIPGLGGSITPLNLVDVSLFNSYDLSMAVVGNPQNVVGNALAFRVTLTWYDDLTSNLAVFSEIWNPWVVTGYPATNPRGIIGDGPMHGKYFTMTITNLGANTVTVQYLNVFGSPRNLQVSDWRQYLNNEVSDAVLAPMFNGAIGFDNNLADTQGSFAAVANTTYLMPFCLYAGPVAWSLELGPGIVVTAANVMDIGGNYAQIMSGTVTLGVGNMIGFPFTASEQINGQIILPRSACALYLRIGGTGGNVNFKVVAQQGP